MREVITLQLGNLSNYTATHFWNAQDSYFTYGDEERSLVDHDIHWRAGLGQDGQETFLPRTVVYDLKGGFGSSGKVNALCDPATTPGFDVTVDSLWSGPTAVHTQQAVDRKAYQQGLDDGTEPPWMTGSSVRYWSDFSSVCFHPKSVVHLHDFELGSTNRPFQRFASGVELFCSLDKEHGLIDRDWRPLVEECDVMQGMQIVNTLDDAWGGFASSYLEALRDEYPKSCIWVWGLQAPSRDASREQRQLRVANTAQSLSRAFSLASMVAPLALSGRHTPSNLDIDQSSSWHVSGLLATALESAALPSRLRFELGQRPISLSDLADALNASGSQRLVRVELSTGHRAGGPSAETLDLTSLYPRRSSPGGRTCQERIFGQFTLYRGPDNEEARAEKLSSQPQRSLMDVPLMQRYTCPISYPLPSGYPPIYTDVCADQAGIPVRTVLTTDSNISKRIKLLQSQASRLVSLEERESLGSELMDIADAYRHDWLGDSDEGGDY